MIALGDCACDCGVFKGAYGVAGPVATSCRSTRRYEAARPRRRRSSQSCGGSPAGEPGGGCARAAGRCVAGGAAGFVLPVVPELSARAPRRRRRGRGGRGRAGRARRGEVVGVGGKCCRSRRRHVASIPRRLVRARRRDRGRRAAVYAIGYCDHALRALRARDVSAVCGALLLVPAAASMSTFLCSGS